MPTEDPLLAGKLAAAMTRGIQEGEDPRYVKLLGSLKHFSVYSMESSAGSQRFGYAPTISKHDMADSYLPAYALGIREGGALGMMCSYTSVNGTAFCESAEWQQQWARQKMGFEGNIVTDCGALSMPKPSAEGSMDAAHNAAKGLAAGTDLNCGNGFDGKQHGYTAVAAAISSKLATEAQLDEVVGRSLGLRMRTGAFDPLEGQIYTKIPVSQLGAQAHHELAEDIAAQGLVLLANPGGVLPLSLHKKTAVIGPHAKADRQLLGRCAPPFADDVPMRGLRCERRGAAFQLLLRGVSDPRQVPEGVAAPAAGGGRGVRQLHELQQLLLRPRQEQRNQLPVLRARLVLRGDPLPRDRGRAERGGPRAELGPRLPERRGLLRRFSLRRGARCRQGR